MMITQKLSVALAMAFVIVLAAGCGEDTTDTGDTVRAMNLKTGQTQEFKSSKEVPPGWGVCPDNSCTEPPRVPCQNLGDVLCEANPECRLRTLDCSAESCVTPTPVEPDDPGCVPAPPTCRHECVPKKALACEEITDEKLCTGKTECAWDAIACMMGCTSDGECPPCPVSGMCRTKAPRQCVDLGEQRCSDRPDCQWSPAPCSLAPCNAESGFCPGDCPAFCQVKPKVEPCPMIAPPAPNFCEGGKIVAKRDPNGCYTGYKCLRDCPPIAASTPDCRPGQTVEPIEGPNGCVTGFRCKNECPAIAAMVPHCPNGTIRPKNDPKTGCIVGYTCEVCPALAMVPPNCGPNEVVSPKYGENGCLVGYVCSKCPQYPLAIPSCLPGTKLVKNHSPEGCLLGYRCEADPGTGDTPPRGEPTPKG